MRKLNAKLTPLVNSIVVNGSDNDLFGGEGNDNLAADGGRNYLDGGEGDNILGALDGNNRLVAGAGNDNLQGGGQNTLAVDGNILAGGAGDGSARRRTRAANDEADNIWRVTA